MSRSGYSDDCSGWELIRWRGAVASAIRGKRGQEFLRRMKSALEALPKKELYAGDLQVVEDGEVCCCAMGAIGLAEDTDMTEWDPYDHDWLSSHFDVAEALTMEVSWVNDEMGWGSPARRFELMMKWVEGNLAVPA